MTDPIPLILSSIRLTKGIHPKFFYLGEGARNWVRFSKDRKYRLGNAEEKFLVRSLPEILRLAGTRPVNIVDLGPGTGYKGRVILQRLRTCRQPAAYVALDISEEILRVALKNIRESLRGSVRTRSCVIDFEDRSLKPIFRKIRQDFHKFSLVLLLGSGNVTNKPRVMQNIRGGMAASDYFLLSAELLDPADVERVLRPYRRKESHDVVSHGL
jgi:L-histidine N-alpha-methyltransferase